MGSPSAHAYIRCQLYIAQLSCVARLTNGMKKSACCPLTTVDFDVCGESLETNLVSSAGALRDKLREDMLIAWRQFCLPFSHLLAWICTNCIGHGLEPTHLHIAPPQSEAGMFDCEFASPIRFP